MSVLGRIKDLLRTNGYTVELSEGRSEWTRGDRWIIIRERSEEEFDLHGNCIEGGRRERCNCQKDYVLFVEDDLATEEDFFKELDRAVSLQVFYYSIGSATQWKRFPLDTPHSVIVETIDALPGPRPHGICYCEGNKSVVVRRVQ